MIIIDAYAIHYHCAMMIIFNAACVTGAAVVGAREFIKLAEFAVDEVTVVPELKVYTIRWFKGILIY